MPQDRAHPCTPVPSAVIRIIVHLPFQRIPVEPHILPADSSIFLQPEADFLSPYLVIMQFQDMLHTPLITVFFLRHVNLAVIPEYTMLLKIFMFQFTFFLFIKAVDGSHIIFKSPLNPHVAHVAVALEPFALQAAGCLKGLLKYPPPFIDKTSFIIIKGLFLPHGYVNPYIVRMVFCAISFLQQPFCQSIVFLMFFCISILANLSFDAEMKKAENPLKSRLSAVFPAFPR